MLKKYIPYLVFAFITVLIMYPLYKPGYIFLLDMVWGPESFVIQAPVVMSSSYPFVLALKALSGIIPVMVMQKILLSVLLFLPGVFMYRLARRYLSWSLALWSGLFYMLNPFVYERFLSGQFFVMAGFAFFPLVVHCFLRFLEKNNIKNLLLFSFVFSLYPILSIHFAYIAVFILFVLGLVFLVVKHKLSKVFRVKFAAGLICFVIIVTAINSFWVFSKSYENMEIGKNIKLSDFQAFRTASDRDFGPYFNVLSLYGFWQEDFLLPKQIVDYWWVITLITVILSVIGIYRSFKIKDPSGLTLGIIFIPAVIVAVGASAPFSAKIVEFLFYHLPGFAGLRETGKIIGILAFAYAILVPRGFLLLLKTQNKIYFRLLFYTALFAIPIVATTGMMHGAAGQLKAYDYPTSWYQAKLRMQETAFRKVLFLPWHGYPTIVFAGNSRVVNPARPFFGGKIIAGTIFDNGYLSGRDNGVWDQKISSILSSSATIDENIDFLKSQNVSHIILMKSADWENYNFLFKAQKLTKIKEWEDLVIFQVNG